MSRERQQKGFSTNFKKDWFKSAFQSVSSIDQKNATHTLHFLTKGKEYWQWLFRNRQKHKQSIEEHALDTDAGKQWSQAATDVKSTLVLKKWPTV